jgi:hypothetical protein
MQKAIALSLILWLGACDPAADAPQPPAHQSKITSDAETARTDLLWSTSTQREMALAGLPARCAYTDKIAVREQPTESARILNTRTKDPMTEASVLVIGIAHQDNVTWYQAAQENTYLPQGWINAQSCKLDTERGIDRYGNHVALLLEDPESNLEILARHFGHLLSRDEENMAKLLGDDLTDDQDEDDEKDKEALALIKGISTVFLHFQDVDIMYSTFQGKALGISRLSFSQPGVGVGGLYIGVDWCDKAYVGKVMGQNAPDNTGMDEDDDEVWSYHDGNGDDEDDSHNTLNIAFTRDGLIKWVDYGTFYEDM